MKKLLLLAVVVASFALPAAAMATNAIYQNGYIYENVTKPNPAMGSVPRTFNKIVMSATTNGFSTIYAIPTPCGTDYYPFYGTQVTRSANWCYDDHEQMECGRGAGAHVLVFTTCTTDY